MKQSLQANKHRLLQIAVLVLFFIALSTGQIALAQNSSLSQYQPLVPIPFATSQSSADLPQYLQTIFKFAIAFSAVLAVFMIILGGLQYMSTDAINGQKEGKKKIQDALFGLLLIISSWLILYTVNPKLVSLDLNIDSFTKSTKAKSPITSLGSSSYTPDEQNWYYNDKDGKRTLITGAADEPTNSLDINNLYSITYAPDPQNNIITNDPTGEKCRAAQAKVESISRDYVKIVTPCQPTSQKTYGIYYQGNGPTNGLYIATYPTQEACLAEASAQNLKDMNWKKYGEAARDPYKCQELTSTYIFTTAGNPVTVNNLTQKRCQQIETGAVDTGKKITVVKSCTKQPAPIPPN